MKISFASSFLVLAAAPLLLLSDVLAQTVYIPGGTSGIGSSSTGGVGVGIASPAATIQVNGNVLLNSAASGVTTGFNGEFGNPSVGGSGGFRFNRNSTTSGDKVFSSYHSNSGAEFYHQVLSATTDQFIFNGGNVGIGTTTPVQKLDVNGFLALGGTTFASYSSGNINVYSSSGAFNVYNNAGTTALLTALNTGAVGIGTTSPGYKLDVHNDDYNAIRAAGSSSNSIAVFVENDISGGRQWAIASSGGGPSPLGSFVVWDGTAGTPRMVFDTAGNVGIGTSNPTQKLAVNGTIRAKEVVVDTGWSDYVFADNYRLAPLSEVEQRIKADKHLPGIPSAQEVAEHGVTLGEMQSKLLAKIEELTLHVIEQEKRIAKLEAENTALRNR